MTINIRAYNTTDKESIIAVFHSNCPKYFDSKDLPDLIYFLDNYADNNFKVIIRDNTIIGCGGHYVKREEKVFGIAWAMFERNAIGHANLLPVATKFFNHILANIRNEKLNYDIVINTSQLLENTCKHFGFLTEKIIENGFGEKLDHYVMIKKWTTKEENNFSV